MQLSANSVHHENFTVQAEPLALVYPLKPRYSVTYNPPNPAGFYSNKFHGQYLLLGQEVLVGLWVHLCQEGPIKEKYMQLYQFFICTS